MRTDVRFIIATICHNTAMTTNTRLLRPIPRLLCALAVAGLAYLFLPHGVAHHTVTRFIVAWNAAALTYIALTLWMIFALPLASSNRRLASRLTRVAGSAILIASALVACLASIITELAVARNLAIAPKLEHIALAFGTTVLAWIFIHFVMAILYAHQYIDQLDAQRDGGLSFPHTKAPTYADFVYVAFIIGTSGQTADVSFTTTRMRMFALVHCVLAFGFNTILLALTINVAASLL